MDCRKVISHSHDSLPQQQHKAKATLNKIKRINIVTLTLNTTLTLNMTPYSRVDLIIMDREEKTCQFVNAAVRNTVMTMIITTLGTASKTLVFIQRSSLS